MLIKILFSSLKIEIKLSPLNKLRNSWADNHPTTNAILLFKQDENSPFMAKIQVQKIDNFYSQTENFMTTYVNNSL